MSLTINHQLNDIINSTGTITINGVAAGGDNTPPVWYGSRGLFGGQTNGATAMIQYVTIATTGNSTDFGNFSGGRNAYQHAGCSNGTRGVFAGSANVNIIDYVTISTTGNAVDFGDLTSNRVRHSSCSNGVRGIFAGGQESSTDVNLIDYITIATTGNSQDFGDLTVARDRLVACADGTRGLFGGGHLGNTTIDYIT